MQLKLNCTLILTSLVTLLSRVFSSVVGLFTGRLRGLLLDARLLPPGLQLGGAQAPGVRQLPGHGCRFQQEGVVSIW